MVEVTISRKLSLFIRDFIAKYYNMKYKALHHEILMQYNKILHSM